MQILGNKADDGLVVADEFRVGKHFSGSRNLKLIKYFIKRTPVGNWIKAFHAYAAFYQVDIFKFFLTSNCGYPIVNSCKGVGFL
jgi:hypothetical protein